MFVATPGDLFLCAKAVGEFEIRGGNLRFLHRRPVLSVPRNISNHARLSGIIHHSYEAADTLRPTEYTQAVQE